MRDQRTADRFAVDALQIPSELRLGMGKEPFASRILLLAPHKRFGRLSGHPTVMRSLLATMALLTFLAPQRSAATGDTLLSSMRNRSRPVLLFAGPNDQKLLREFAELQQHTTALEERQMKIVLVTKTTVPVTPLLPVGTVSATAKEAVALQAHFHIAADTFTLVLVGKDGGEKFRSTQPVAFDRLRDLVDSMPMRQEEMRIARPLRHK